MNRECSAEMLPACCLMRKVHVGLEKCDLLRAFCCLVPTSTNNRAGCEAATQRIPR
jgi:hypothetical protein